MTLRYLVVGFALIYLIPIVISVLDDSIQYSLNWPGKGFDLEGSTKKVYKKDDAVVIRTQNNEQYECMIPTLDTEKDVEDNFADAKSPVELISPLLKKKPCAYRLEAYWSYEICHGKHIRQYHEEKTSGGEVHVQEYYLGYFNDALDESGVFKTLTEAPKSADDIPSKKIDEVQTPYYQIDMANGTPCDLMGGTKRKTQVLYVCHPESRNEIMTISETSSCEYEMVVLTPELCENPFYKIKGNPTNNIYCSPIGDAPIRPKALDEEILEQNAEEETRIRTTLKDLAQKVELDLGSDKDDYRRLDDMTISPETDKALLREFLNGDYCLNGGSGWWKYEFCYGKHVKQYHDDKTLGRTTIMVGKWDESAHMEWAKKKDARMYKNVHDQASDKIEKKVYIVEHFYQNGDFCEAVNKPREVVVRLKCKSGGSKHSVTIYLREPSTCSYILGVESPIICDLLDTADENGLFDTNI